MENVKLPTETAREPEEEAHEPQGGNIMSPPVAPTGTPKRKNVSISFSETPSQKTVSQNSSAYKEALSQPAPSLSHRQRLLWLQKRRSEGLWAQCDSCSRWRYLPHVLDSHELPAKWFCSMNPDKKYANCSIPEAPLHVKDEEDLIHSEYSAGSVVWARMPGWPWWPAMVDDCPDIEQYYWLDGFSDIPTYYNVVFFDTSDCTRAWITPENLKPYEVNKKLFNNLKKDNLKKRLEVAQKQADDADALPLKNRLAKYSFIARYPGAINRPRKFKKNELKKFHNQLKRKYNIEFPNLSETDSEDESDLCKMEEGTKRNVILLGTPKHLKQKRIILRKENNNDEKQNSKSNYKLQELLLGNDFDNQNNSGTQNNALSQDNADSQNKGNTEDSVMVNNGNTESIAKDKKADIENNNKEPANAIFKQPDSMAVQIGSNATPSAVEGAFDNDTSKTYVPESECESESVLGETMSKIKKRAASPASDDFEF